MSTRRRSRSSGGNSGGAAALFGILLVVGLFFAARAVTRHVQERRAVAKHEAEEIAWPSNVATSTPRRSSWA